MIKMTALHNFVNHAGNTHCKIKKLLYSTKTNLNIYFYELRLNNIYPVLLGFYFGFLSDVRFPSDINSGKTNSPLVSNFVFRSKLDELNLP
jgi:hypothetical protein